MEAEEALVEVEVGELGLMVGPGDSALRGFDAVAGVVVVEHNLAGSYALLFVNLPEDGGTRPKVVGADFVAEQLGEHFRAAEALAQPDIEIIEREAFE